MKRRIYRGSSWTLVKVKSNGCSFRLSLTIDVILGLALNVTSPLSLSLTHSHQYPTSAPLTNRGANSFDKHNDFGTCETAPSSSFNLTYPMNNNNTNNKSLLYLILACKPTLVFIKITKQ